MNRLPRVVIAGQVPPPFGGQNVMILRILEQFRQSGDFEVEHLAFRFTPDFKEVRRASAAKLVEFARVLGRLARIRRRGRIDLLIFPAGGPQTVPILRDILLLPFILLAARRVAVQFHAAGIADRCAARGGILCRALRAVYGRCVVAIVMTAFNRRDPEFFHFPHIEVLPYRLPDEFSADLVRRDPARLRLLNVGHLCVDKGTPDLLRAFQQIAARHPDLILDLVGETLPPLTDESLREMIRELGLEKRVVLSGLLTGRAKQEAFGRADLFVFPTVAPYESFGLVMVEAMMWGLPIVATDWRGNRDVLGADFEGVCHPVEPELSTHIAEALETAVGTLREGKKWSGRNRELFLARYRYDETAHDYARHAARWLAAT